MQAREHSRFSLSEITDSVSVSSVSTKNQRNLKTSKKNQTAKKLKTKLSISVTTIKNGENNVENKKTHDESKKGRGITSLDGALLKEMVSGGAKELRSNIEEVNKLNVFPVPDGDTGDNMFSTVNSGVKAIESLDTDNLAEVMRVLSHGMLLGARGNSGVILSQFFKGIADGFQNSKSANPKALGAALELGVKEAYATVMTPTEGTILTVAREAVERSVAKINPKTTIKSFFNDFVKELHASVERTPESLPALKEAGVVDSGGAGLFYLMDGFNRVLRGGKPDSKVEVEEEEKSQQKVSKDIINERKIAFDENTEMKFSYCTELLVQLMRTKCDTDSFETEKLKDFLISIGDSAAVVKCGSVLKIHVHTLEPDKVLNYLLKFGEFIEVKIENMSLQHSENSLDKAKIIDISKQTFTFNANTKILNTPKNDFGANVKRENKRKKYGIVAVSVGDGIDKIFREMGADETILAKDGKSPSAYDFSESAKQTNADDVFIFPNNKNFILSAEQARKMTSEATLHVIPSRNIAHGYVALSVINLECESPEEICDNAKRTIANTRSGAIFISARDTQCSGIKIKSGEFVGTIENDIIAKSKNAPDTALKICKKLLEDKFMLTVFKGKSASTNDTRAIEKKIKKSYPEVEIYFIESGQDVFEYIFCAE